MTNPEVRAVWGTLKASDYVCPQGRGWNTRSLRTSTVRNTVALIPSAISYSPFSLGRVKLYSLPGPNILKDTQATVLPSPSRILHRWNFSPFFTVSWKTPFPSYNIILNRAPGLNPYKTHLSLRKLPSDRKRRQQLLSVFECNEEQSSLSKSPAVSFCGAQRHLGSLRSTGILGDSVSCPEPSCSSSSPISMYPSSTPSLIFLSFAFQHLIDESELVRADVSAFPFLVHFTAELWKKCPSSIQGVN